MSVVRRTTIWLFPCLVLSVGCTSPSLLGPLATHSDAARPYNESVDDSDSERHVSLRSGQKDKDAVADSTAGPSSRAVAEGAMIRRTALEKGYSRAEARRLEQSVLNAAPADRDFLIRFIYAQMGRQSGATSLASSSDETESADQEHDRTTNSPDAGNRVTQAVHIVPSSGSSQQSETPDVSLCSTKSSQRLPSSQSPASNLAASPGRDETEKAVAPQKNADDRSQPLKTGTNQQDSSDSKVASASENTRKRDETHLQDAGAKTGAVTANGPAEISHVANTEHARNGQAEASDESWQRQLRSAIARLRHDLADEDIDPVDASRMRVCLGLLHLAIENPEQAMEALEGLDSQQLEFWRQTILGLDILLDSNELPKMRHRVESASEHLQDGLVALADLGPLRVSNLAFAREVRGFADYDEMGARGFVAGEETILYVEIGNFSVTDIGSGAKSSTRLFGKDNSGPMYEAVLLGRYDILDSNQRVVMSRTLPVLRDHCRRHRRDFFIAYPFHVPKLDEGHYTLELTIEDKNSGKFGNGTIDLKVR